MSIEEDKPKPVEVKKETIISKVKAKIYGFFRNLFN